MIKVDDSYLAFRRKLKSVGKRVTGLTPREGFEVFQEFYASERILDVEAEQGDGLAAYFGMSRDGGAVFEVGMVRVFRRAGVAVRDANARLRLSFAYRRDSRRFFRLTTPSWNIFRLWSCTTGPPRRPNISSQIHSSESKRLT